MEGKIIKKRGKKTTQSFQQKNVSRTYLNKKKTGWQNAQVILTLMRSYFLGLSLYFILTDNKVDIFLFL